MSAATDNLRDHQEQSDMDGCMVKVSRQAVEETLAEYAALLSALALVSKGLRHGVIPDQTLLHPGSDSSRLDMTPLSKIIDAAIAKAVSN